MTAPQDIPGAAAAPPPSSTATTSTTRNRASTFSYPRWDANGNSHHPPPDVVSPSNSSSSSSSRSQAALTRSMNGGNAGAGPSSSSSSSSSILRLLGLSPKAGPSSYSSSSSSTTTTLQQRASASDEPTPLPLGDTSSTHHQQQHRRGASLSATAGMTYSPSYPSTFYEDDEDGPPEAITPPQMMPLNLSSHDPTTAQHSQTHTKQQQSDAINIPTNYGSELDATHKMELDDAFDAGSVATTTVPKLNTARPPGGGEALGRRASWSPARPGATPADQYSASPPAGVLNWLHGQQTSYPISTQQYTNQSNISNTATNDYRDYGASPVGLFRRLSLSVNRRPPPPAPASTISEVSDINDVNKERIGRPLTKVTSAPPRRLSPMGERMLRAHYDSFS